MLAPDYIQMTAWYQIWRLVAPDSKTGSAENNSDSKLTEVRGALDSGHKTRSRGGFHDN